MAGATLSETTQLLRAWAQGDQAALQQLTPRVYDELRRIAGHFMQNERQGHTLQTTALVHEAYLRLIDVTNVDWQHRAHFFAISAPMMRRLLPPWRLRARSSKRQAGKRGGNLPRVNLEDILDVRSARAREVIALDDALNALAEIDPRKARVIELRFFGGLSVEETVEVMKISERTVMRDWDFARAWLMRELSR